jgi:hypothetical protein
METPTSPVYHALINLRLELLEILLDEARPLDSSLPRPLRLGRNGTSSMSSSVGALQELRKYTISCTALDNEILKGGIAFNMVTVLKKAKLAT